MHSFISIATSCLLALPLVAGRPASGGSHLQKRTSGDATHYTVGLGACGWTNSDSENVAALAASVFDSNNPCGKEVSVKGPKGTIKITVVDRCEGCDPSAIDLSPTAFQAAVGDLGIGRHTVQWEYTGKVSSDPAPNYPDLDRSQAQVPESDVGGGGDDDTETGGESPTTTVEAVPEYKTPEPEPEVTPPASNEETEPEPEPTTTSTTTISTTVTTPSTTPTVEPEVPEKTYPEQGGNDDSGNYDDDKKEEGKDDDNKEGSKDDTNESPSYEAPKPKKSPCKNGHKRSTKRSTKAGRKARK